MLPTNSSSSIPAGGSQSVQTPTDTSSASQTSQAGETYMGKVEVGSAEGLTPQQPSSLGASMNKPYFAVLQRHDPDHSHGLHGHTYGNHTAELLEKHGGSNTKVDESTGTLSPISSWEDVASGSVGKREGGGDSSAEVSVGEGGLSSLSGLAELDSADWEIASDPGGVRLFDYQNDDVKGQKDLDVEVNDFINELKSEITRDVAREHGETKIADGIVGDGEDPDDLEMETMMFAYEHKDEIESKLSELHSEKSIPKRLIEAAKTVEVTAQDVDDNPSFKQEDIGKPRYPQLLKTIDVAKTIVKENDAVVLPGGFHINPLMFGDTTSADTMDDSYMLNSAGAASANFQREMLEFALINEAQTHNKPLMGICRGHQAISVFHGAKLELNSLSSGVQSGVKRDVTTPETPGSAIGNIPEQGYFSHKHAAVFDSPDQQGISLRLTGSELIAGVQDEIKTLQSSIDSSDPDSKEYSDFQKELGKLTQLNEFLSKTDNVALAVETGRMFGVQFHPEKSNEGVPEGFESDQVQSKFVEQNEAVFSSFVELTKLSMLKADLITELKSSPNFKKMSDEAVAPR